MKSSLKTLVVILGPTSSGKTALAIELAKTFQTEIISADSRQFYKEIPIGTAAPTKKEMEIITHHFVGHLSITEEYNVSRFEEDVIRLLEEKFKTHQVMIMCGGSGLYIDAVCKGIDKLPNPDIVLREKLNDLFLEKGIESLQQKLKELDPEYYTEVDLNNSKRLMRAIEVCIQTGHTYSELRLQQPKKRNFNIIRIGLEVPREDLILRIHQRTEWMLENGWIDEVKKVMPFRNTNALNTVGYKELFKYLDGEWDIRMATEKIKTNTRRYAKRQMTWFRKNKDVHWFSPDELGQVVPFLKNRLSTEN